MKKLQELGFDFGVNKYNADLSFSDDYDVSKTEIARNSVKNLQLLQEKYEDGELIEDEGRLLKVTYKIDGYGNVSNIFLKNVTPVLKSDQTVPMPKDMAEATKKHSEESDTLDKSLFTIGGEGFNCGSVSVKELKNHAVHQIERKEILNLLKSIEKQLKPSFWSFVFTPFRMVKNLFTPKKTPEEVLTKIYNQIKEKD